MTVTVPASLFDAGRALIQGFIDGIKSLAGSVAGAVTSAIPGGNIVGGAAKKAAGFLWLADGGQTPGGNRPFWVGEEGPELMAASRTAFVMDNESSMAMASAGGATGGSHIAGNLVVQTNDSPKRWFDEGLWRIKP